MSEKFSSGPINHIQTNFSMIVWLTITVKGLPNSKYILVMQSQGDRGIILLTVISYHNYILDE